MSKTLKELAQEALEVQNACNLCGVAQSFARVMRDLNELGLGTDRTNKHPIAILWADKIAQLSGTQNLGHEDVMMAYSWCHNQAV